MVPPVSMNLLYSLAFSFSTLVDSDIAFFLLTIVLAFLFTYRSGGAGAPDRRSRQAHLAAALLAAFVIAMLLKPLIAVPRPCQLGESSLVSCPLDYSMPSIHSVIAFTLALCFLGRRSFWPLMAWALAVSSSRLFLGVHSPPDIFGSLALAVFAVALADRIVAGAAVLHHRRRLKAGHKHHELKRKLIQIAFGLAVLAAAMAWGIGTTAPLVACCLFIGLILFHLKSTGIRIPIVDLLLIRLERADAPPGLGALTFVSGLLFSLTLLPAQLALTSVLILAVSDSVASLAGRGAPHRLPHNPQKSYAGSTAFVLFGAPAYLLAGLPGVWMVLAAAVLESLPLSFDDNLLIPLSGVAVMLAYLR